MSKRILNRKPTGAELRAQRDQRLSRPYELQEAGRREASFLKNIATAGEDLEWILSNRGWKQLGFDRAGDWWDARIRPAFEALDVRPSNSLIERALVAITEDEQELPGAQRRTQRELAALMKTTQTKIARSLPESGDSAADLENDSGDVDSPPVDVSGQTADEPLEASADGGEGVNHSPTAPPAGDGHVGPVPGHPLNSPSQERVDESQASDVGSGPDSPAVRAHSHPNALVGGQPGFDSSLARDEAPPAVGAAQPPDSSGDEPGSLGPDAAGEDSQHGGNASSAAQNLIEGQTPSSPAEPVLSPAAVPGVAEVGDPEVGEELQAGTEGFSSTDPVSDWMDIWRALVRNASVVRWHFTDNELAEVRDDIVGLGKIFRPA